MNKAADPGKLKDERKWTEWEPAFVNYLSTIPGVTGVPLSYVIRELETPTPGEDYGNFNERSIACVALTGTIFRLMPERFINSSRVFSKPRRLSSGLDPTSRPRTLASI